jgi:hypothetical protein
LRTKFLKNYVAHKTLKIRHRLVKWLCPHIAYSLEQLQTMHNYITKTPRPMILAAKKHFPEGHLLRGIEIGVAAGDNSLSILKELAVDKLFLIDPYVPYEFDGRTWDASADYAIAHTKLAEYPQVVWMRKTSESAIREFQNEEAVDFVYIDGNHSYESVKKDITLYYQLIKNNGLIGGHDYTPYYETVMRAVNEFAEEAKLELHTVFPDWWFTVRTRTKKRFNSSQIT